MKIALLRVFDTITGTGVSVALTLNQRPGCFCYTRCMQKFLCKSKNGVSVTYDPVHSHAATHLEDTPQLAGLVAEVTGNMDLTGQAVAQHVDLGRIIGTCDVVAVDETDSIIYGIRKNRYDDGLVPFTNTRKAQSCRYVTVQLVPKRDGTYELLSAWIGTWDDDEPFPLSQNANARSIDYWSHFAFVLGSQEIVPGTRSTTRPW